MNAGSTDSGRDPRPPWSGEVIPCPQCGEGIPEFALACPYCGSRFEVTRSGYCPQCRAVASATAAGACEKCGAEMMDVKVERTPTADQAVAKQQVRFDIILKAGGSQTIKVIKVVRALTGLGLPEAMDLVEGAPNLVRQAVDKAEAEDMKQQLEAAGATVQITAQGAALPPRVQPEPRPAAGPSSSEEPATSPAAGQSATSPAAGQSATSPAAWSAAPVGLPTGYSEGIIGSPPMNVGRALLTLAPLGLIILWFLQLAARGRWVTNSSGEDVFLATRGNEAYVLGIGIVVLAVISLILLSFMLKGRAGGGWLYRPKGLLVRLWIILALWLAGLAWYIVSIPRGGGDLAMQSGGYAARVLVLSGLVGALLALIGWRGRRSVWIDREGHIVETAGHGAEPRGPEPAPQMPAVAAKTEAMAMAEARGRSVQGAVARKPRSRRFWVLLASAGGAVVVAAAIVVAVLYGGGSTEEQARSLLARADVAIRAAAAENLTWHYSARQVTTMEGNAASGTLTNTMEGDVEPPQRARLSTEVSASDDLTGNLPIMGRVTLPNGEEGYGQEALSVDGGNSFYVRALQDGGDYSEWVETEEKAFVIFAEGWDLSEFVSNFSELLTELEVAGSEEVEGVKCDVIKAKADIARLLEARKDMLAGLQNFDLNMLAEFMKDTPPQVKIWIGTDDDLPYRITMKLTVSISEGGMTQSLVMDSMENVTRYGEAVSPPIEAPNIR